MSPLLSLCSASLLALALALAKSEQLRVLKKNDQIPDTWRLASIADMKNLKDDFEKIMKGGNQTESSYIELQDGYIQGKTFDNMVTSKKCDNCLSKVIVKGSFTCSEYKPGFYIRRGHEYGMIPHEKCLSECRKAQRNEKQISIMARYRKRCFCGHSIQQTDNNKQKSCTLLPTIDSPRGKFVYGQALGDFVDVQDSKTIEQCHTACIRMRESDQFINGMSFAMEKCNCVRNMTGIDPGDGVKSRFLSCAKQNFKYFGDIIKTRDNTSSWQECAQVCRNRTACHFWSWRTEKANNFKNLCNIYGMGVESEYMLEVISGSRDCFKTFSIVDADADASTLKSSGLPSYVYILIVLFIILVIVAIVLLLYLFKGKRKEKNAKNEVAKPLNDGN